MERGFLPHPDLFERHIFAWLKTGSIQFSGGLGVDDFFIAEFRQERESHRHFSVGKSIHERMKTITV